MASKENSMNTARAPSRITGPLLNPGNSAWRVLEIVCFRSLALAEFAVR